MLGKSSATPIRNGFSSPPVRTRHHLAIKPPLNRKISETLNSPALRQRIAYQTPDNQPAYRLSFFRGITPQLFDIFYGFGRLLARCGK